MQATKVWLETDALGRLVGIPTLPPCRTVEVTLRVADAGKRRGVRTPPAELAAATRIRGDLTEPAITEADWDALQ